MQTESLEYSCHDMTCHGILKIPKTSNDAKLPGIVIAPAWRGRDHLAIAKAEQLAGLGYLALAADIYGNAQVATTDEESENLMRPLFLDRKLLRERINAAVDALRKHPLVDQKKIGAIGFCFGGLTVIELLRSGADVTGVVSFHGVLGYSLGGHKAAVVPLAPKIKGALLILHGNEDPLVSPQDLIGVREEFTRAGVDWQIDIYGHAMHAFTNPEAHDSKQGLEYNTKADQRSWKAMENFFSELFK